jgi:hypothetical protein
LLGSKRWCGRMKETGYSYFVLHLKSLTTIQYKLFKAIYALTFLR